MLKHSPDIKEFYLGMKDVGHGDEAVEAKEDLAMKKGHFINIEASPPEVFIDNHEL